MRQVELKSRSIKGLCLFLAGVSLLAAGCRDNPQEKAAKEVHKQIQAALALNDNVAAQQQIQSAIAAHRPAGLAQDSANWVSGNLMLNHGLARLAELSSKTFPVRHAADAIAARLLQSQQWLLEKDRIEKMLAIQDSEIVELNALLNGTPDQPGLHARLARVRSEMATLMREKQAIQEEKDAVQSVIDQTQARSESLLKQADLASGDEKLRLQQQAYALQLERKDDYVKTQSAENKIAVLDSQIALVQQQIQSFESNILETSAGIEALETAESRRLLKQQQAEIDQLLSEQQKAINEQADVIKTALAAYRQAADAVIETLERTAEHYQRVRSGDAGLPAVVRQADSHAYAAMACAAQLMFLRETATRLAGTLAAADETLVRGLAERLPLNADPDPEQIQKMIALFDLADQAYEEAMALAQRLSTRSKEAAVSVLKSRLLMIQNKMQLADALAQYELASQTQTRLEELKQLGQEYGSLFTLSETVRLLDQGLTFVPSLPVNVELYFEGVRQKFAEWKRLGTPEQQAAAVERNFIEMDELIGTYGDEMSRLLEPLRQEMQAAKERGFETAVSPTTAGPGDPNSFR